LTALEGLSQGSAILTGVQPIRRCGWLAVALAVLTTACTPWAGGGSGAADAPTGDGVQIARVVDGDTLATTDDDRIRLAILDTPEPDECGGPQATAFAEGWVADHGPDVVLRRPGPPDRDPFGRLLGEVVAGDEQDVSLNVDLAAAGHGRVDERFTDEDPDLAERLRAAQAQARADGSGLWACPGATDG
jgi:endonuclease YncB( thermonuclease family)